MSNEAHPAISVKNVSKEFTYSSMKASTLKNLVTGIFASEDPLNSESSHSRVLNDVSFEVQRGDFYGIVGRNGSGKSTLLKVIANIYSPTTGTVQVNGKVVPFIELGIGFNGELTGRENVYLNGALLGYSRKEVARKLDDIIRFSELRPYIDHKLKNYSSGMQVRLAFSVATRLSQSNILIIDEVLAVGDADFQRKCFDYFKSLKKQKKTVIFVTHDMNAVREYCNKAMLIDQSEVIAIGDPEMIATEYTKLFQHEEVEVEKDEAAKRWGTNEVTFSNVKLSRNVLKKSSESLLVMCDLVCNRRVEEPVIGISIMDSEGQRLFGTNTRILKKTVPNVLEEGQKLSVEWSVPHIFNEGKYGVCVSIGLASGIVCDSWDDARYFQVYKEEGTSFFVDPPIECKISD